MVTRRLSYLKGSGTIFKVDPGTEDRLDLLATAAVGEGGWVGLTEPCRNRISDRPHLGWRMP
jgi:hypothetical protein